MKHKENMLEIARGRANLYNLLASIFSRIPDKYLLKEITSQDQENLLDIFSELNNNRLQSGINCLKAYICNVKYRPYTKILTELTVDWTRILRTTGFTNLKPPYERLYKNNNSMITCALDIRSIYRKAGLLLEENVLELPDYLCIEIDFMYQLCHRELEYWLSGKDTHYILNMENKFLREHLGYWVGDYCMQAQKYVSTDFYRGWLIILDTFIRSDMEYLQNSASEFSD